MHRNIETYTLSTFYCEEMKLESHLIALTVALDCGAHSANLTASRSIHGTRPDGRPGIETVTEMQSGRTLSETCGFMKALVSRDSDEILGFAAVGPHAGEVLAVVQTAMMGKLPYTLLRDAVFTQREPFHSIR